MKVKERRARKEGSPQDQGAAAPARWPFYTLAAAAIVFALWSYAPALHGPFVFDDPYMPLGKPLREWIGGGRPLLQLTYWWSASRAGDDTSSFHAINILIHLIVAGLVFLIVRRLLEWASVDRSRRTLLSGFAAALFLLHPVQTEAVAYIAGRSESFAVMMAFAAYAVFLYRPQKAASWPIALAVLFLFGLALLSKEHTIALPALLLLTDYWWNPGFEFKGIWANWKIYAAMALAAAGGIAFFWGLITRATSAGFGLKDFTWYQYFFTEWRALLLYIALFFLPVRLTADWDFPISKTLVDHGAVLALLVLLALIAAAWHYRRRFPLATFGFFVYLVLMAPTSSILPIQDPVAERRLYTSMIGLLLIVVDALSRVKLERRTLAAICVVLPVIAAFATHARAQDWGDPVALWEDTVSKSPDKWRPHFQLGSAYFDRTLYQRSVDEFQKSAALKPPGYELLIDWALAYDALNQPDQALAKLRQAAAINPTAHVYTQIGMVYAKRGQWDPALEALATAEKHDPGYAMIYVYRGGIFVNRKQCRAAIAEYTRALSLQPDLDEARRNLVVANSCAAAAPAAN
jgi:tetratricopeptide (TPR) repeat protein